MRSAAVGKADCQVVAYRLVISERQMEFAHL